MLTFVLYNKMFKSHYLLLFFLAFSISYSSLSQTSTTKKLTSSSTVKNSVLSTGTWYKFAVDTTGVFKIDRTFLQNLGISVNDIDPKNIRIFGNGGQLLPMLNNDFRYDGLQENAIQVIGEDDNSFDVDDFILFYAKGPHQWIVNTLQPEQTRHQNNIYSDKAYYFISIDNGPGKRIQTAPEITSPATLPIKTFNDYLVHEKDEVNLFSNGQQWFGQDLSFENTTTVNFTFSNIDISQDIYIRVRGVIESFTTSSMDIKVNDQNLTTINFPAIPSSINNLTLAIPREAIQNINVSSEQITVEITYNNNGNPSARAHLDYVEILGYKNLIANDKQFSFRNFQAANEPFTSIVEYNLQNSNNISQIWNVTDYINPTIVTNQSTASSFIFKANGGQLQEYIVLNESDYFTPEVLSNSLVSNQNLHILQDVDYIIVTQDYLSTEAERLSEHHRANSNLNVLVIDINHIYNEFSSGSPDLTAIRDFVRHLYVNATSVEKRIKFVCLFGDASYDFKDRINSNNNIIPAFQSFESFDLARSYVTDDYFGMMDDSEGFLTTTDQQDVATGRFPVTTITEAKQTVDKTLSYYATSSFGDWRNKIAFVADDPDTAGEFVLQQTVERIADDIALNKPELNIIKIYADAFVQQTSSGGERYPDVEETIDNAIETGYVGFKLFRSWRRRWLGQ